MLEDRFPVEATAHGPPPDLDWNLLVTSMERHQRDVRRALRPVVALRTSPFRNVLLGRADDPTGVIAAVEALAEERPRLHGWIGKLVPIVATFGVDPERFVAQAEAAIAPFLGEAAGRRFHVRIERRGHKGQIDSHAAERIVGAWAFETLRARGTPADVDFDDPDIVIAIEIVGNVAGVAVVSRALRQHRFVRVG